MTSLLLRLAGPLQSWGESARFARRTTERAPTKSGVLGMLAAASGRRRTDPLEDLLTLRFGVRVDQPGRIERDFQTSVGADGSRFPLTDRYYLTDAVFLAAIEGDHELVTGLDEALRAPAFPLYLGRRSCPPEGRVSLGVRDEGLWESLSAEPWLAATWWKRRNGSTVQLDAHLDVHPDDGAPHTRTTHRDVPLSFDPERREYGWREVSHVHVPVVNDTPAPDRVARPRHDPMAALGGA
ncbi:type I-E CRISPR-associated protein Cas5/CasD [Oerskovia sp. KBS0722]|uniref:type I-E CRISPR-associated protein Cas5/CasD n=1 Tax=Oerskovia sp. KBS0722 TaxID=1179673 RepID=UPI00110EE327|nr:type I-E CRISPR-associated protein Cas5/CasD [Oerskovia sp. KBS0722]QDW62027.1 type I-E CRISPR-associated protein Cas5/CasD [Oerskovia sp. KBS0722]